MIIHTTSAELLAKKNGYSGRTSSASQGCNCHGNSPTSMVNLTPMSKTNSFTVKPGTSNMFSVTVTHPTLLQAGINIGVKTTQTSDANAGTLSIISGEGLVMSAGELVHSSPKAMSSGSVTFAFNWTAPNTPGKYYLRAIGNAVNANGKDDTGDKWNWMVPQVITVEEGNSISDDIQPIPIFPNPFKEIANINLSSYVNLGIKEISIYNSSGVELIKFESSNIIFSWDGRDASGKKVTAGIYYLSVIFEGGHKVIPIVSL